ncbi:FKBP-type peptidyl-prolyl cis-trans isomerase [Dyadobacter sp. CY345]|uniref:FKBP-type peptidyl-prolyl cis-trans isomerase n=1 Tax=Dyadobacter sp. CY345 TaxID=2909335 RepID=UPI001F3554A1|nr:FKBP-type peptidyl-prolyl cis-trans isomerase [Dyadobacter sp. CY345]MCF2445278.1 FKBP-type peptidyl-prolyl cis-trans isomerase [Dyadobacter sp. CY345]
MKSTFLKLGLLAAVVVGMVSCNDSVENDDEAKIVENEQQIEKYLADSSITATRDSSGLYYVVKKSNPTGAKPKTQEAVTINFNAYLLNGTKIWSSENADKYPFMRPYGLGFFLGGVERGLNLIRTGESATFYMPFYLAFGSFAYDKIPAYSVIKMNVEFVSSRTEVKQIDDFIQQKQFPVSERSTDNLVIVRTNTVTGDTIGSGKVVSIAYKGKLLTGEVFDKGEKPLSFTTGRNEVIPGFDRAIRKMRKGEKATIIFPSTLGYGKNGAKDGYGNYVIYPYSPLQFDVEVQ